MHKEKGVTLISLAILIIVMLILAGTAIYSGIDAIDQAKLVSFSTKMQLVQNTVNVIHEKGNYTDLGQVLSNQVAGSQQVKILEATGKSNLDGFRYFSIEDLKAMDLEGVEQPVLINVETREVIAIEGVLAKGKMYYRLEDIPNTTYNIKYVDKNTQAPTFSTKVISNSDGWKIALLDIVYQGNNSGGTVQYKLQEETAWRSAKDTYFQVYEPGIYNIKLTDNAGNSTVQNEYLYAKEGLLARYDGQNNIENGHDATARVWKDLSGNNKDASFSGFATTNSATSGWNENYLAFDGIDDFLTPNFATGDIGTAVTISTRIYTDKPNSYRGIFGNHTGNNNFVNGIIAQFTDGVIHLGYNSNMLKLSPQTVSGKICTLTMTMDKTGGTKVYIDGELKGELKVASVDVTALYPFWLGKSFNTTDRYFSGKMYNFIIYNRTLTQQEIISNYTIDKARFNL